MRALAQIAYQHSSSPDQIVSRVVVPWDNWALLALPQKVNAPVQRDILLASL